MRSTLPMRLPTRAVTARQTATGHAHAKAILLGEHAVVYGAPALAVPLHGLGVTARVRHRRSGLAIDSELFTGDISEAPARLQPVITALRAALHRSGQESGVRLSLRSDIPYERGLGSSAAVAAAVIRAVAATGEDQVPRDELYELVQQAERVAHGKPSGLDARAVTSTGPIRFDAGIASPIHVAKPLVFTLADSGSSGSTALSVAAVRARRSTDPSGVDAIMGRLGELAEAAVADLTSGADGLGPRMREAHDLLGRLGVSNEPLDRLVDAAHRAGSPGAKLTGGGQGGCIIALAESTEHADRLAGALHAAGAPRTWTTTVPAS